MKHFPLFGLLACLCLPAPARTAEKDADLSTLVQGNNQTALSLYAQVRGKEGNLFLSPYSISSAFGMLYAGARADTAKEMATSLNYSLELDRLMPAFGKLNRQINGDGKARAYQLSVANALWGRKDYRFLPAFLGLTRDHFGAGIEELDYAKDAEAARKHINAWVEKQTSQRIKDLLPPGFVDADTTLVLTNAIYFKGDWAEQFKKDRTRDEAFKLADGKTVKTPLMNRTGLVNYFETRELQGLELAYKGKELSMVVLLPRKIDGLTALGKDLTEERLGGWLRQLRRREVIMTLPRFKMTKEINLIEPLKGMGMKLAFTPGKADLSGLSGASNLYVSGAIHKAFVEVNEEGTEAAGATGIGIKATSAGPPEPVFRADHPFLFLIRDVRTGSILFLGRLVQP